MKVKAVKTDKITKDSGTLFEILDKSLTSLEEGSVVAITSKIVSICEGRIIPIEEFDKESLVKEESELYMDATENKYNVFLTIKNGLLIATAGIDESNGDGYYVLWPKDAQKTANEVLEYLKKRFGLKKVGVIITDSKTTPLRWGTSGVALSYSGFSALNNYIGTDDLFGRQLKLTKANISDSLAVAGVLEMGEGNEQTPIAVISDVSFVNFTDGPPSKEELSELDINIDDDLYAPLIKNGKWKKGKAK